MALRRRKAARAPHDPMAMEPPSLPVFGSGSGSGSGRVVLGSSISMRRESQTNLHNQVVQWSLGLTLKHQRKQISGLIEPIVPRTPAYHVNSHQHLPRATKTNHQLMHRDMMNHYNAVVISERTTVQLNITTTCENAMQIAYLNSI